jgi:Protein of unknown function (DUF2634).
MIPSTNPLLNGDIEFVEQSSHTFYLDVDNNIVFGFTNNQEAMKQAIYLTLETERFKWVIFSWNYGAEFDDLFGMPISWVIPEVKRRISEALLQDPRITAVDGFEFEVGKGKLTVNFTAWTIYGDIPIQKGVNF